MRHLLALLLCLAAVPVRAQTAPPTSDAAPASAPEVPRKSPRRAVLLSGGGTALIVVPPLALVALPIGPSLGHFYAGNTTQALVGIGLRTTALVVGVVTAIDDAFGGGGSGGNLDARMIGCITVVLGSAAYDIATAGQAARAYNRRAERRTALVLPVVGPDGQRGIRLAVQL